VLERVRSFEALCRSELLELLSNPSKISSRTSGQELRALKVKLNTPVVALQKDWKVRAVRIGLQYRALAIETGDDLLWFWIGSHSEYDKLIG
jgi:hypothetical protein